MITVGNFSKTFSGVMVSRLIWRCVLRDTMIPRFAALESQLHFSEDCCRYYISADGRMALCFCIHIFELFS
jgi:hypothetical protein